MAFIRRVRSGSGATGVQVAEYAGGRQRILKRTGRGPLPAKPRDGAFACDSRNESTVAVEGCAS